MEQIQRNTTEPRNTPSRTIPPATRAGIIQAIAARMAAEQMRDHTKLAWAISILGMHALERIGAAVARPDHAHTVEVIREEARLLLTERAIPAAVRTLERIEAEDAADPATLDLTDQHANAAGSIAGRRPPSLAELVAQRLGTAAATTTHH